MKDISLKLMFNILKNYMNFIISLWFLSERMEIEKVKKLLANSHDKIDYTVRIRYLKQALNHE